MKKIFLVSCSVLVVFGIAATLAVIYYQTEILRFILTKVNAPRSQPMHQRVALNQPGTIEDVAISSHLLNKTLPVKVYLPGTYKQTQKRLPVLYFLHGTPGDYRDWLESGDAAATLDRAIAYRELPPVIAVFPEEDSELNRPTEYANRFDGSYPVMDYLNSELVDYIDNHYRTLTLPQDRFLIGLSEGGYGAVNIVLHHPERFGTALSLSGYFTARDLSEGQFVFGKNTNYLKDNSPIEFVKNHSISPSTHLYLTAEIGDEYETELHQFEPVLTDRKIPATVRYLTGVHGWDLWRGQLPYALIWVDKQLKENTPLKP